MIWINFISCLSLFLHFFLSSFSSHGTSEHVILFGLENPWILCCIFIHIFLHSYSSSASATSCFMSDLRALHSSRFLPIIYILHYIDYCSTLLLPMYVCKFIWYWLSWSLAISESQVSHSVLIIWLLIPIN